MVSPVGRGKRRRLCCRTIVLIALLVGAESARVGETMRAGWEQRGAVADPSARRGAVGRWGGSGGGEQTPGRGHDLSAAEAVTAGLGRGCCGEFQDGAVDSDVEYCLGSSEHGRTGETVPCRPKLAGVACEKGWNHYVRGEACPYKWDRPEYLYKRAAKAINEAGKVLDRVGPATVNMIVDPRNALGLNQARQLDAEAIAKESDEVAASGKEVNVFGPVGAVTDIVKQLGGVPGKFIPGSEQQVTGKDADPSKALLAMTDPAMLFFGSFLLLTLFQISEYYRSARLVKDENGNLVIQRAPKQLPEGDIVLKKSGQDGPAETKPGGFSSAANDKQAFVLAIILLLCFQSYKVKHKRDLARAASGGDPKVPEEKLDSPIQVAKVSSEGGFWIVILPVAVTLLMMGLNAVMRREGLDKGDNRVFVMQYSSMTSVASFFAFAGLLVWMGDELGIEERGRLMVLFTAMLLLFDALQESTGDAIQGMVPKFTGA